MRHFSSARIAKQDHSSLRGGGYGQLTLTIGFLLITSVTLAERPNVVWTRAGHSESVLTVDITPAGDRAVSASLDGTMKTWDIATGEMLYSVRSTGPTVLSPDGTTIATQGSSQIQLRSISDGTIIRTLGSAQFARSAWSPDGQRLASADIGNVVRIWNANNGLPEALLSGHTALVRCVAYSPNGAFVVTGAGFQGTDNTARVWSTANGQQLRTLSGHGDYVGSVAIAPDSSIIATGSGDKTIKLWQSSNGALLRTLTGAAWPVWALAFSPDGQHLASLDIGGALRIWNVTDGALLLNLPLPNGGRSLNYSADGQTLIVGTNVGPVELRSAADGVLLQTLGVNRRELVGLGFSDDGRMLAHGDDTLHAARFRARDGQPIDQQTLSGFLNSNGIVFSPDLETAATLGGFNTDTQLWSLETGEAVNALSGHVSVIFGSTFSPDGQLFATAGEYQAGLWNVNTGQFIHWFQNSVSSHHDAVAFSADGAKIALSDRNFVKIFDVGAAALLRTLNVGVNNQTRLAFSPDGSMLVSAGYADMWAWDVATGALAWNIQSGVGAGTGLQFTRDGQHIFSSGRDGIVQIHRASDGDVTHTFDEETGEWVTSLALSPTGRTFAFTRADATLVVARNPLWTVGDVDGDGCVTLTDLSLLLADFGRSDEPASTDLDDNGATDLTDLSLLLAHFGDCGE